MGQARDQIDALAGMVRNARRNGTINADQARAVEDVLTSGDRARDKVARLKQLVGDAERNRVITAQTAQLFWTLVGGRGETARAAAPVAPPTRRVTITLDVSGTAGYVGGHAVNQAVEGALAPQARRLGLLVRPGSVAVAGV